MYNLSYLKGVIFRAGFIGMVSSISAKNIIYQVLHEGVASILLISTVTSHLLSSVVEMKGKNLHDNLHITVHSEKPFSPQYSESINFTSKKKNQSANTPGTLGEKLS